LVQPRDIRDNRVLLPGMHRQYLCAFLNVGTLCWPTMPAVFNPKASTSGLSVIRAEPCNLSPWLQSLSALRPDALVTPGRCIGCRRFAGSV
jgi:hypothetical protein